MTTGQTLASPTGLTRKSAPLAGRGLKLFEDGRSQSVAASATVACVGNPADTSQHDREDGPGRLRPQPQHLGELPELHRKNSADCARRGLAVQGVAEVKGNPKVLDDRGKTLHPRIARGILAVGSDVNRVSAPAEHEITLQKAIPCDPAESG